MNCLSQHHILKMGMPTVPPWIHIVVMFLVFSLGMLLTYTMGVSQQHFRSFFPYISDTGVLPLENGFFVLVFGITSLFLIFIAYIRFKDAREHVEGEYFQVFNTINFICAIIAIFFLLSVAAFEFDDSPASSKIHAASAALAILLNYLYAFGQIYIGTRLSRFRWKWVIFTIQLVMTIFGILLFFYFFATRFFSDEIFFLSVRNVSAIQNNATLLERYNNGLKIDYSRAVVEWIIFVEVLAFFLTFIPDFRQINVAVPVTRSDSPKEQENSGENELEGTKKNN